LFQLSGNSRQISQEHRSRLNNTQGDGLQVEYGAPTEPARAGREAWLTGGGDDAQVVYAVPYQRR